VKELKACLPTPAKRPTLEQMEKAITRGAQA
jgi:hypothetical protein